MTPYTALYDDVMPELPGIELPLVLHTIKRVCNDFYERSLYIKADLVPVNVVSGTSTYGLVVADPADHDISKLMEVVYNGKPIRGQAKHYLDQTVTNWRSETGSVVTYTQEAANSITLVRVPSESISAGLKCRAAVVPQYGGAGIDDVVFSKFADALAAGVKGRLMTMTRKPWSDPSSGRNYAAFFEGEVAAAGAIAARAYGSSALRSKMSP